MERTFFLCAFPVKPVKEKEVLTFKESEFRREEKEESENGP